MRIKRELVIEDVDLLAIQSLLPYYGREVRISLKRIEIRRIKDKEKK